MSYIVHYGTKGMKKGVRKWTNSDGTLNEAGKLRYQNKTSKNIFGQGYNPDTDRTTMIRERLHKDNKAKRVKKIIGEKKTSSRNPRNITAELVDKEIQKKMVRSGNMTIKELVIRSIAKQSKRRTKDLLSSTRKATKSSVNKAKNLISSVFKNRKKK